MNSEDKSDERPVEAETEVVEVKDVYLEQDDNLRSKYFYFYFLTEGPGGDTTTAYVAHRLQPILIGNVPDQIKIMLDEMYNGTLKPSGSDLGDIVWRHKGYIVVVLDSTTGKMTPDDGMTFTWTGSGGGNHCFRAGKDVPKVPKYEHLSAFYCFNHMRKKGGGDLGPNQFEWFHVVANHIHRLGAGRVRRLSHDDSATNLGPPR